MQSVFLIEGDLGVNPTLLGIWGDLKWFLVMSGGLLWHLVTSGDG